MSKIESREKCCFCKGPQDLRNKDNKELKILKVYRLSIQIIKNAINLSKQALSGKRPEPTVTNHTDMANPYGSLYLSEWKQVILKTATMKRFISINQLVQQIYFKTKKVFAGTMYDGNFYLCHDALFNDVTIMQRIYD